MTFRFSEYFNIILSNITGLSQTYTLCTYSRELETEADSKGMDVLEEMVSVCKGLWICLHYSERARDVGSLKLLSTHPLTEERMRVAEEMAKGQKGVRDEVGLKRKGRGLWLR